MTTAARLRPSPPDWLPEPNENAPDGWEWAATDNENLQWQIGGPLIEAERQCRYSEAGERCPYKAEVILWRGAAHTLPWAYCQNHMYGRWIEDGVVMHWTLRKREGTP